MWQLADEDSGAMRWARVEGDAVVAQGTVGDVAPIAFDVAPLGSDLAIPWSVALPDPVVGVSVVDEAGEVTLRCTNTEPPSAESVSLHSGPSGAGLLLGYGADALTRLDCDG